MTDNRNTILAVILSGLVLIAWQYFYNVPQMEKQRVEAQKQAELAKPTQQATPGSTPGSATPGSTAPGGTAPAPQAGATPSSGPATATPGVVMPRDTVLAAT